MAVVREAITATQRHAHTRPRRPIAGSLTAVSGKDKYYIVTEQVLDTDSQKEELLKELGYLKGFLESLHYSFHLNFHLNGFEGKSKSQKISMQIERENGQILVKKCRP